MRHAYYEPYKGGIEFKKHLFRIVGDLEETDEEYNCAVYIKRLPEGKAWVRNTSRQPHSFWLQTSSDKFYPDFVALLNDGRVLVIEYKGAYLATTDDTKEKQLIGDLWAERSEGGCVFVMVENREFGKIDAAIRKK
jgi:type III restriction enzyme